MELCNFHLLVCGSVDDHRIQHKDVGRITGVEILRDETCKGKENPSWHLDKVRS